jgi:hypothetical protein
MVIKSWQQIDEVLQTAAFHYMPGVFVLCMDNQELVSLLAIMAWIVKTRNAIDDGTMMQLLLLLVPHCISVII